MLILVAPPLFAASIYMTLGRLILRLDAQSASLIPVRWLTKIFVVGDVISFILQCGGTIHPYPHHFPSPQTIPIGFSTDPPPGGGYMAGGTQTAMTTGAHIVIAGLAIQLVFFGVFILVASVFHQRVTTTQPITRNVKSQSGRLSWSGLMWALYLACALILIRSVFRVVEFVQGNDGFIMRREYLLYIFDALLMALTGMVLGFVFPGSFLDRTRGWAERVSSV